MKHELSKTVVVLLSGKAGVGKTTCANFMITYTQRFGYESAIEGFVRGVKIIAVHMGWDGKKDEKGRIFLQHIGRDGREYNPNMWVERTEDRIANMEDIRHTNMEFVFVDDWRFPNELDYLKKNNLFQVFTVRVFSPEREILKGTPAYDDISETSLPEAIDILDERYDYVINNLHDLDTLEGDCQFIVDSILERADKWE